MHRLQYLAWFILFALLSASRMRGEPTLTDFWNGHGTWVQDARAVGSQFNFHFLSIMPGQRELSAYYIRNRITSDGKLKMGIGLARGVDGIHWTEDGSALGVGKSSWDDRIASFPGIWKDGGTWYLVYEGGGEDIDQSPGDIGLATSADGKHFVKHRGPILRHNPVGWERANIGTPSLMKEKGTWYLFYHGYDYHVCQIGVATGKDLLHLVKSPANPILTVSSNPAAWDCGTVGKRSSIVKEGPYYYFAFEGSTAQPYASAKWSSGLARTTNLTSKWEKFPGNPVLPQTPDGMGYDGPELVQLGATTYVYVRTPKTTQSERFRLEAKVSKSNP